MRIVGGIARRDRGGGGDGNIAAEIETREEGFQALPETAKQACRYDQAGVGCAQSIGSSQAMDRYRTARTRTTSMAWPLRGQKLRNSKSQKRLALPVESPALSGQLQVDLSISPRAVECSSKGKAMSELQERDEKSEKS